MKTTQTPQNENDVLIKLLEMEINRIPESNEEIEELLKEGGLDPEKVRANAVAISKIIHQSTKDWRKAGQEITSFQREYENNKANYSLGKITIIEKIKQLLDHNRAELKFAYRNLDYDELSENDLQSILQQMESNHQAPDD
jgi:hypothetical protein